MKITNKMGLPQQFVDAVSVEHAYTPKRYSVTQILKSPREAVLERRHDDEIEADASDMIWSIWGQAVHKVFEQSEETPDELKEEFVTMDMGDGYVLSGRFDLYNDSTGTVTDWKTCSAWKIVYKDFHDWEMQTMLYCLILRSMGFDAKRGEVVAVIRDWSRTKAMRERDYPQSPVFKIGWDFDSADLRLAADYAADAFDAIRACEQMDDEALPLCSREDRWHKPGKWAVMKKGRQKAVRLFDSFTDAQARCNAENEAAKGEPYYLEERPGTDGKCAGGYCRACAFCDYWKDNYSEEE